MNVTNIPENQPGSPEPSVASRVLGALPAMSPQLRKAARYVLDNPNEVGVSSIREIAEAAEVTANSLVRMARAAGFEGYEDLRRPFREALRSGGESFPDRARWLQGLARGGRHTRLFGQMAGMTLENCEQLFSGTTAAEIKAAAERIVAARTTYVLGLGISYALAHNFAYLARMALDTVVAVPRDGGLPIDDLARVGPGDLVLAMTFKPYRSEVVDAVRFVHQQGGGVIALSDSRSAPIALLADQAFVIPTETPQFFTSTVAAAALLETLMAFVVADADEQVVANIEGFHRRRYDLGVYLPDED